MTQMSLFTQVKNDPNAIISWGRIDPNGNIYEAWILDLKCGRWIAWGAKKILAREQSRYHNCIIT